MKFANIRFDYYLETSTSGGKMLADFPIYETFFVGFCLLKIFTDYTKKYHKHVWSWNFLML